MYKLSLAGMNVGEGGKPDQSGESWVLKFLRTRLCERADAPVVFDVGANTGQFAQGVLAAFGNRVRLWSFEPCRIPFELLQRNLSAHPNVTLVNAALGSNEGPAEIFSPAPGSILASLYHRSSRWQEKVARETVPCRTLDGYCAENAIKKIHFLKIDVEGHELEVLRGANAMLAADGIDFIQFEVGDAHIDARVYFRDFYNLLKEQYGIYRVLQNGLAHVEQYRPELELFKRATNFLAVRKT